MDYRAHRQARRREDYSEPERNDVPEDERALIAKLKLLHDQTRMSIIGFLHPHMRMTDAAVRESVFVQDEAFYEHMNALLQNGFVRAGSEAQQPTYYLTNACRRVIARLDLLNNKPESEEEMMKKPEPDNTSEAKETVIIAAPAVISVAAPKTESVPEEKSGRPFFRSREAVAIFNVQQPPSPDVFLDPQQTPWQTMQDLYEIPASEHGHRETLLFSAALTMQNRLKEAEWKEYSRLFARALNAPLDEADHTTWLDLFARAYAVPPEVAQNIGSIVLTHPDKRTEEQKSLYDMFAKQYLRA